MLEKKPDRFGRKRTQDINILQATKDASAALTQAAVNRKSHSSQMPRDYSVLDKFRRLFLALTSDDQIEFLRRLNPALLESALEMRKTTQRSQAEAAKSHPDNRTPPWTEKQQRRRPNPSEIRSDNRSPVTIDATIVRADGLANLACKVTDVSEFGCRIALVDSSKAPENFRLLDQSHTRSRLCHVQWRTPTEIGVEFIDQ